MKRKSYQQETTTARIRLRSHLPWQDEVDADPARFKVLACARRVGKTSYCEGWLAEAAIEGFPVAYYTPVNKDLTEFWENMKVRLDPVIERVSEQERRLELDTGGVMEFWSTDNPDSSRGRKYKRVVLDEFSKMKQQKRIWSKTVRPTLADYRGEAIFAFSPFGMNYAYELYLRGDKSLLVEGEADPFPSWKSWQLPTSANPLIDPHEIEEARLELTADDFSQEWEAKFVNDGSGVFRNVDELSIAAWQEQPIEGHLYSIGVDIALTNDYSVFAVYDITEKAIVHLQRSNNVATLDQATRLLDLYRVFNAQIVHVEDNSYATGLVETLQRHQIRMARFHTSNQTKQRIVTDFQWAMENKRVRLPAGVKRDGSSLSGEALRAAQECRKEFKAFLCERNEGGMVKYHAPRGFHDDIVMSCCLARDGAEYGVPKFEMRLV